MSGAHSAQGRDAGTTPDGSSGRARIGMIWAQAGDGVIGDAGTMPWSLPEDMAHFKRTTLGHPVIMGRRTWESIPPRFRPFAGRTNIVLTSDESTAAEVREAGGIVVGSPEAALDAARAAEGSDEIWVCGGGQVYATFEPLADTIVVTVINAEIPGDTTAPRLGDGWKRTLADPDDGWLTSKTALEYRIELWEKTL
ncbi:dihydrofolate reductase [Zafaria sp. Z1313]|uniref:dihydrofolate reductase n=1 Tax=unclassified Zafaria TaxID=2828765 RepID=UPI002E7603A6|nr:dihydrofolate reductase [Zafaria sp. J156]MEE1620606.1 dihydrofolate reductase [Zafaria sp. J156]